MKVRVISSRDPNIFSGMIGDAEERLQGDYLVCLSIIRTTTVHHKKVMTLIVMEPHEIEIVEPQITNKETIHI